jgi:hypothetical protein
VHVAELVDVAAERQGDLGIGDVTGHQRVGALAESMRQRDQLAGRGDLSARRAALQLQRRDFLGQLLQARTWRC